MESILTSVEAELLIQFEQYPSLEMLAKTLYRDPTAISRQLKRISEKGDFLTKASGRWKITDTGQKFNQLTKDYLLSQKRIVNHDVHLKVGSTREFCIRVLAPNIKKLEKVFGVNSLSLISFEGSVENALLSGQIDLAFDCGRPYSPDITFKQVLAEPISPVVSSKIFQGYKNIQHFKDLEDHPHILCDRLHPDRVSKKTFRIKKVASYSNDIAVARSLCLASHGWGLLPVYAIKEELRTNKLRIINNISFSSEKFGVWYLRERKSILPLFFIAIDWLRQNEHLMAIDMT